MKKILVPVILLFACAGLFARQPVVAVAPFEAISGITANYANMITRACSHYENLTKAAKLEAWK